MVLVQVDISETLNKNLRHYVIDNDLKDKREAIVKIVSERLTSK